MNQPKVALTSAMEIAVALRRESLIETHAKALPDLSARMAPALEAMVNFWYCTLL